MGHHNLDTAEIKDQGSTWIFAQTLNLYGAIFCRLRSSRHWPSDFPVRRGRTLQQRPLGATNIVP